MAACNGWNNTTCEGTDACPPRCPRFFDKEGEPALVRAFREDDREELIEMYESMDRASRTQGIPPRERAEIAEWVDDLCEGLSLICRRDGRLVGHVATAPASVTDPELVVFVHHAVQNRGIGSELLKQLIAYSAADEKDRLRLVVSNDNQQAITVYENIGFELVDREFLAREMELPLRKPIADRVQRPPAEQNR